MAAAAAAPPRLPVFVDLTGDAPAPRPAAARAEVKRLLPASTTRPEVFKDPRGQRVIVGPFLRPRDNAALEQQLQGLQALHAVCQLMGAGTPGAGFAPRLGYSDHTYGAFVSVPSPAWPSLRAWDGNFCNLPSPEAFFNIQYAAYIAGVGGGNDPANWLIDYVGTCFVRVGVAPARPVPADQAHDPRVLFDVPPAPHARSEAALNDVIGTVTVSGLRRLPLHLARKLTPEQFQRWAVLETVCRV